MRTVLGPGREYEVALFDSLIGVDGWVSRESMVHPCCESILDTDSRTKPACFSWGWASIYRRNAGNSTVGRSRT